MSTHQLEAKAFIFDLDGTIVDTTPVVINFWTQLAISHHLDPKEILKTSHGRRTIETLALWIPELATPQKVLELETKLSDEMEGVIVLPGVIDLIDGIDRDDWTINTAGTHYMATARLSQFHIPVPSEMVTGDKISQGKPHPEGYLKAAALLGKSPQECIVFEDAPAGVMAAISAGAQCIACVTTHTVEQLKEAGATVIVDRLDSVHIQRMEDGSYSVTAENCF
ncbi:HAD-superfamily hydrolase subfamily IA, variant 3 [Pilobolus umbonatus]|nr:HAD-superfamily hydrolase subfamily IA, variant 3 [Pilobolus umbonatus]